MPIFKKKSNYRENEAAKLKEASDLESAATKTNANGIDDKELAAVIMASLMSFMDVHSSSDLNIKSIKRIGRNTPIWNTAGRDAYIASKL